MRTAFIKSGSRQNWFINFFESNESTIFNLNSNLLTHCSWTSLSFYLFLSLPCFKSFFPSRLLPFFIFFSHPSHFLLHLTRLLTAFFFFFFFFAKGFVSVSSRLWSKCWNWSEIALRTGNLLKTKMIYLQSLKSRIVGTIQMGKDAQQN